LAEENPDATVVAGATDVGLWITKQLRDIRKVIHIGAVEELHEVSSGGGRLRLGAAATYAEAEEALSAMDPDLGAVLRRIGSKQVRSTGTVGGNIANGSPIGDMPPMLIALGATVTLRLAARERVLPLEDFFIAYGKQDRLPGELVWHIDVPMLKPNECFRAYKVSKRFDQDISAVLAAFRFSLDGHLLRDARIAFGGMAATPKCASHAEAAAMTISLDHPESWNAAIDALADDFAPISDMRATAAYRLTVAKALFRKALTEVAAKQHLRTRLTGQRGKAA
jgi:xanthine dehydrogenase small subunit